MAVDAFVNFVRVNAGLRSNVCHHISTHFEVLLHNPYQLDGAYGSLDHGQNTLGILAVLLAKYYVLKSSTLDFDTLLLQTQEFLSRCDVEDVRYSGERFADLFHRLTAVLVERKSPERGIPILSKAITALQDHPAQLTSLHSDLCQLCLLAKRFRPALPFIKVYFTDIQKEGRLVTDGKPLLTYFYYSALIFIAQKELGKAIENLEIVIGVPAVAVSHVMIEAYKKYLILSLLHTGLRPVLKKSVSVVVNRYIKPIATEYHELVTAFISHTPLDLLSAIGKHRATFQSDDNLGLVLQCAKCQHKKKIHSLTKTFLTLSLTDVANRAQLSGPEEAEKYLIEMIESGEIAARIKQRDGMVEFQDSPEKYNNAHMMHRLQEEISECVLLNEKMSSMDRELTVDPLFVTKMMVAAD